MFNAETFGKTGTYNMGLLGRGINHELFESAVPSGEDAAALEWAHRLACGTNCAGDRSSSSSNDRVEVLFKVCCKEHVVTPLLVHQGRAGFASGEHVAKYWQFLDLDADRINDVLGLSPCVSHTHCDQFADMADLTTRQYWLIGGFETRQGGMRPDRGDRREIVSDKHLLTAFVRNRGIAEVAVSNGAPEEGDMAGTCQLNVADKFSPPTQVAIVFLAQH